MNSFLSGTKQPGLLPVQIIFTDGTTLRCRYERCFTVDGFGRCPVDELRRGDVIHEGRRFDEWRTVEKIIFEKEKAPQLLAQTERAKKNYQDQYTS